MNEAFLRTQMLLGADALDKLSRCHVIVFGLGGVGSYAAECLARSGVGEQTLVAQDTLSPPTTQPTATISSPPTTTTSWTPLIWSAASWI
mgnify:CR=1 FL=1